MEADTATLVGAVGSLISGAKAAADTVTEALSRSKGNKAAEDDLRTIQASISSLQSRTFEIQEIIFSIQQRLIQSEREKLDSERENAELREQIRSKEEWSSEREQYVLSTVGKAIVRVKRSEPGIHYCPSCFASAKLVPLQPAAGNAGKCPSCKQFFAVGAR